MKTVVFDFDGTLTYKTPNIWKAVWQELGYSIDKGSYYRQLFADFMAGRITHQEWCDLTCKAFVKKDMTLKTLNDVADRVGLIDGFDRTLQVLNDYGVSCHIVSGNIINVITRVLGDRVKYFDSINANTLQFGENDKLLHIKGTNYDFEGKARFINELKEKTGTKAKDITFVGNGANDEWAHMSGCKTLCINPSGTDMENTTKWYNVLPEVTDLTQILPYIVPEIEQF